MKMQKSIFIQLKKIVLFIFKNLELVFWLGGLFYLAFIIPEQNHFSVCPLTNMGFQFCPGCGLGRSISMIFHFRILESFQVHPLGLFALIIIIFRIIQLIIKLRREHYA